MCKIQIAQVKGSLYQIQHGYIKVVSQHVKGLARLAKLALSIGESIVFLQRLDAVDLSPIRPKVMAIVSSST
jgi:SpoU rRNA methylase family enzyme